MNTRNNIHIERKLTITETDMVNGGEILILIAYGVKVDDEMYSFPAPQIFNKELYERNRTLYDQAVREFRNNCEISDQNEC